MSQLEISGIFPNITLDYVGGPTRGGMDGEYGRLYLRMESQGSGSEHAIKNLGFFRSAVLNLLDDTPLSATAVVYHMRKTNETGERFDEDNNCYYNVLGFDCWVKQDHTKP
jgi:hypothetical protein